MSGFDDEEEGYRGTVTVLPAPDEKSGKNSKSDKGGRVSGGSGDRTGAKAKGRANGPARGRANNRIGSETDNRADSEHAAGESPDGENTAAPAVEVRANLAGHFSPLTGDYRWRGRLSADDGLTALFEGGAREVLIRTAEGHEAVGTLDKADLWGGHPVSGAGAPPFEVPRIDIDD